MKTFQELYKQIVLDTINGTSYEMDEAEYNQMDCLLNPGKHPVVWRIGNCDCPPEENGKCAGNCPFDAFTKNADGNMDIDPDKCVGCNICVDNCKAEKLTGSKDIIPVLNALKANHGLSYTLIAPAFLGQFGKEVTPGQLRTALKQIGFDGMVEVAVFADILTLKEALEFDKNILTETDYQLTSCCCPIWIAMIRKVYHDLMPHVPGSVSPMIASGRTVKQLHPDALTVFIGPCVAKKAEAKEADIAGAVDYVLTFQEIKDIFEALDIDPAKLEESDRDHSSRAGRIYARSNGVSEAVQSTVKRLNPDRSITVRTKQADGVPACKEMINSLLEGKTDANFFEGMGCKGGCVGGPKSIIDRNEATAYVNEYADSATFPTPIDNPYVIELLHRLGFDTIESLLEDSDIFTRHF